jgi:hypothetical protein
MGCLQGKERQATRSDKSAGTFHYFAGFGRGEQHRMLLRHANVSFVDHKIEMSEWPPIK